MRINFLIVMALWGSSSSWALSNEMLIQSCWVPAEVKLLEKAERQDCEAQISELKVEAIDNRWYNPSKYVWFSCPAECPNGSAFLEVMVQYHRSECN